MIHDQISRRLEMMMRIAIPWMQRRPSANRVLCPVVCLAIFGLGPAIFSRAEGQDSDLRDRPVRIVGYLPDYRAAELDPKAIRQLTHLVVFSAQPNADGTLDMSRLKSVPWDKIQQAKKDHRLRVILCVGGWERSNAFPGVAKDESLRKRFADDALRICHEQRLDGIDIDWEHPHDESEQKGYAGLLAALSHSFRPKGLEVSVTMAAWQQLPKEAFPFVDYVQIMSYDKPGKHSTLENAKKDVEKLVADGASKTQITLGVPFYARHIKDGNQVMTYRQIVEKKSLQPDVDELDGFFFNGPETITKKVRYVVENKLAGVMIWEIGQDATGNDSLLQVIRSTFQSASGSRETPPKR